MVHQVGVVWGQAAPTSPRSLVATSIKCDAVAVTGSPVATGLKNRGRSGRGSVINGAE